MTLSKSDIIRISGAAADAAADAARKAVINGIQAAQGKSKPAVPDTIDVIDTKEPQEHVEEPEIPPAIPPRIGITMSFNDRGFCKPETALTLMKHSDRVFPLFFIEEADIRHTAHASRPWLPSDAKQRDAQYLADAGSLNVADWWRWFLPPSIRARWYFQHLRAQLGPYFDFGQPIDVCIDVEGFFRSMYNARLRDQSIASDTREMEASDHAFEHLENMEELAHAVREAARAEDIAIGNIYWYGTMRAATNNPTRVDPWPIISSSGRYYATQAIYPRAEWNGSVDAMEDRIAFLHSETHWRGPKRYFIRPWKLWSTTTTKYAKAINATRPVEILCWDNMRQGAHIGSHWQEDAVKTILEATA